MTPKSKTTTTTTTTERELTFRYSYVAQQVKVPLLSLQWLWCRPAARAPIRPLAWQTPYAVGAALEKAKRQNKIKKIKIKNELGWEFPLWLSGNEPD